VNARRVIRVLSLVPSATETLVALGVPPVACTRFCDLPGVPTVGGTKNPDVAAIIDLQPDVVVVNDEENRIADADALRAAGITLHSMSPRSVAEVGPAVVALAAALGVPVPAPFEEWDAWCARAQAPAHVSAFVATWRRPYMTMNGDTYGSSLLACVGVDNVFGASDERYPEVTLAAAASRHPQLVLLPDEPYAFAARHIPEVEQAIPAARVRIIDGRDLFWWGIRTPAAVTRLARVSR
jgi:ABC-type Fe3+-hydroxamate transport system substrate-binding protein